MLMIPDGNAIADFLLKPYVLVAICIIQSYLMIAEIPLIALKFKKFSFVGNEWRYVLIILGFILLVLLKQKAVPLIIILYVILSLLQNSLSKPNLSSN
jgi:CDP-diacylglycerol--serine O-phosphatidyltransferase